eukprot:223627_1
MSSVLSVNTNSDGREIEKNRSNNNKDSINVSKSTVFHVEGDTPLPSKYCTIQRNNKGRRSFLLFKYIGSSPETSRKNHFNAAPQDVYELQLPSRCALAYCQKMATDGETERASGSMPCSAQ